MWQSFHFSSECIFRDPKIIASEAETVESGISKRKKRKAKKKKLRDLKVPEESRLQQQSRDVSCDEADSDDFNGSEADAPSLSSVSVSEVSAPILRKGYMLDVSSLPAPLETTILAVLARDTSYPREEVCSPCRTSSVSSHALCLGSSLCGGDVGPWGAL
jgi:hypothetical protein